MEMNPGGVKENNDKIANVLLRISKKYAKEGDKGRKAAYEKAATAIKQQVIPITSGNMAGSIKNIGKSISTIIDEYLGTGQVASIFGYEAPQEMDKEQVIAQFKKIHGVGDAYATAWYNQGYRSLEALAQIYPMMTPAQQIGYRYLGDFQLKIPREEIDRVNQYLHSLLDPTQTKFEIAGSYRRRAKESGDIDVLVQNVIGTTGMPLTFNILLQPIKTVGLIIDDISPDAITQYMGVVRVALGLPARRMDIHLVTPESWPFALLYFTGSADLNKEMREYAKSLGLILNQEYLADANNIAKRYQAKTEQDIFNMLGLRYLEPWERNGDFPLVLVSTGAVIAQSRSYLYKAGQQQVQYQQPIQGQQQYLNQNQPYQNQQQYPGELIPPTQSNQMQQPYQPQQNQIYQPQQLQNQPSKRIPSGKWYRSAPDLYVYVSDDIVITPNIAGFDLDHTLISPNHGQFPKTPEDANIMYNRIPTLEKYIAKGYTLAIFTNQGGKKNTKEFKYARVDHAIKLLNLPVLVFMSTADDEYRKPKTGMFKELQTMAKNIDMQTSFYSGDASGRQGDFSDSDLLFAKNIGLRFYTPEQIFGQ